MKSSFSIETRLRSTYHTHAVASRRFSQRKQFSFPAFYYVSSDARMKYIVGVASRKAELQHRPQMQEVSYLPPKPKGSLPPPPPALRISLSPPSTSLRRSTFWTVPAIARTRMATITMRSAYSAAPCPLLRSEEVPHSSRHIFDEDLGANLGSDNRV